ncbi:MAG TPA: hypothetical protein VKA26_03880 [Ignavibacteriaceae bacterium]|nr:hypothetical protein [Ignavibacteriaceae bacterium]
MTSKRLKLFEHYDVRSWLHKLMKSEPDLAREIIRSNARIVAGAFDKSTIYVDALVSRNDFESFSEEEIRMMKFFFKLCQKRMP